MSVSPSFQCAGKESTIVTANMIELGTFYDYSGYVLSLRTCCVPWAVLITLPTFALMK